MKSKKFKIQRGKIPKTEFQKENKNKGIEKTKNKTKDSSQIENKQNTRQKTKI